MAGFSLQHTLAGLLVAQIAVFVVAALLYWGGLRRLQVERRVTTHLGASHPGLGKGSRLGSRDDTLLVRACLGDIPESQRAAIPWFGAMYRLDTEASFKAFVWLRIALALLGFAASGYFLSLLASDLNFAGLLMLLGGLPLAGINWWATRRYVASLSRSRQDSISQGMPYALDLILICLDSGVALEAAISRVAAELSARDPLVAEELYRTLLDINVLGSREQAFRNLGERVDTANMRNIVTVLCQALQYGSSLAASLKEAIQNMKRVELLDLEERAGKLPVQLSMPGMLFTLPQVIILLAGPGVVQLLDAFKV